MSLNVNYVKLTLFSSLVLLILIIFSIPEYPGYFYEGYRAANVYLPELGINSEISIVKANSFLASTIFMKTTVEVSNLYATDVLRAFSIIFPIIVFLVYLVFFNKIRIQKLETKIGIFMLSYPILYIMINSFNAFDGNIMWLAGTMYPLLLTYLLLLKSRGNMDTRIVLISTLLMIITALWWHSISIFMLSLVLSEILVLDFILPNRSKYLLELGITSTVIVVVAWVYIRIHVLKYSILPALSQGSITRFITLMFQRGNLAGQYSFKSNFDVLLRIGERLIMVSYFIIILLSLLALFELVKKKYNNPLNCTQDIERNILVILIASTFTASTVFGILYLIATSTVGVLGFRLFGYPLTLLYLILRLRTDYHPFKKVLGLLITLVLIGSLVVYSGGVYLLYHYASPTYRTNRESFDSTLGWLILYAPDNSNVWSSATDGGHYLIRYANSRAYHKKILYFKSITYSTYSKIDNCLFLPKRDIVVFNLYQFRTHKILDSLQAWNKFEPLNPRKGICNLNMQYVYNNGDLLFAT